MLCMKCGSSAEKGFTTDVTDLGNCLVIVRHVPCYKCSECDEVIYTADVVKKLEQIVEKAKELMQEISIDDFKTENDRNDFIEMISEEIGFIESLVSELTETINKKVLERLRH